MLKNLEGNSVTELERVTSLLSWLCREACNTHNISLITRNKELSEWWNNYREEDARRRGILDEHRRQRDLAASAKAKLQPEEYEAIRGGY